MEATKKSINEILNQNNSVYSIPVYQRNYVWQKKECEKLVEDITNINGDFYFIGPMIWVRTSASEHRFNVVDGQQRLTTVILMLTAVKNYLINSMQDSFELSIEQIKECIVNRLQKDENLKLKLKPNNQDKQHYATVQDAKGLIEHNPHSSNIINNYNYFYNECSKNNKLLNILEIIRKIYFVLIILGENENPYLIFESINSKGVHLNCGDLIRNFLLMDLDSEKQQDWYSEYWMEMEKTIGDLRIQDYVWHFLRFKLQKNIKLKDVYFEFQNYAKNNKFHVLRDLKKYATHYAIFNNLADKKYPNNKIQYCIEQFHKLGKTVTIPYLFTLIDEFENNAISEDETVKSLRLVETYILRQLFVKGTTQGFNQQFCILARQIKDEIKKGGKYYDALCQIICPKIPSDETFTRAINEKDAYGTKVAKYMLTTMENNGDYKTAFTQEHEVEHIFPQNPKTEHKYLHGDNWNFMKEHTHHLANLTIIKDDKNQQASNKSEKEKLEIDSDFARLWLNDGRGDVFSRKEFEIRQVKLTKRALEVWHCPNVGGEKRDDIIEISPEDDYDFSYYSGTKPKTMLIEYSGKTETLKIGSPWKSVLKSLTEFYLQESPQQVKDFWEDIIKSVPQNRFEQDCETLDCGITIKINNLSTPAILQCVHNMMKTIGIIDNVMIELKK